MLRSSMSSTSKRFRLLASYVRSGDVNLGSAHVRLSRLAGWLGVRRRRRRRAVRRSLLSLFDSALLTTVAC